MIEIKEAVFFSDVLEIERLAGEILPEYYRDIIPEDHIEFFLDKLQSAKTINNHIEKEGYKYFLLAFENVYVGYLGIRVQERVLILSKLYILKNYRGKKIGKYALEYLNSIGENSTIEKIDLTVHRENKLAIEIYQAKGYDIVESLTHSFDNGLILKGYRMQKLFNK